MKEASYWLWWYEARSAWSSLLRSPRYALPALLSLALGVGAATAVFSVFSALTLRPLPFAREHELVRAGLAGFNGAGSVHAVLSPAFAADMRELPSVFEGLALYHSSGGRLGGTGEPRRIALELTSLDFFDVLGVTPEQGRTFTARGPAPDGFDVVVLRHGYWQEALGGAPIVGQTVLVDDTPKLVLGIVPDEAALPSYADLWMPRAFQKDGPRFLFMLNAVGRLAPGVSLELGQERLTELTRAWQIRGRTEEIMTGTLTPLRQALLGDQQRALGLMLATVFAFLLLACANLAALLGTRASVRQHERAIRSALGASSAMLARQNVFEALWLGLAGGALGLVTALAFTQIANDKFRAVLGNTPARLDLRVVFGFFVLLFVVTLVGAAAPALQARRTLPMDALRGEGRSSQSRRARRVRELLLVVQVATSLALLVNAGLLLRTVRALLDVDPGFDARGVVAAAVAAPAKGALNPENFEAQRAEAEQLARSLHERLLRLPGVTSATVAGDLPFDWFAGMQMIEPEAAAQREIQAVYPHFVSPGYFETLGIPLLAGRDITVNENANPPPAIVNRTFAREVLGVENAVGHAFRFGVAPDQRGRMPEPPWLSIVGMVDDALERDLTVPIEPAFYLPLFARPMPLRSPTGIGFAVAVKSNAPPAPLMAALPLAIREVSPEAAVFIVEPLAERVAQSYWERSALSSVLSAFAVAAMILAAIGLFGVTGYTVAERAPEIGIRRALGASRAAIVWMILRETGLIVCAGIALGVISSRLGESVLESFLFGISSSDVITYLGVCSAILLVGLFSAWLPAWGASRISPSRALVGR